MNKNLRVKCHHLVNVQGFDGDIRHIMFKPTQASVKAVAAALQDGGAYIIEVDDISGEHTSINALRVVSMLTSYGTVIFVTENA